MEISFIGYSEQVLFFARVVLGVVMFYYGWPKVKDLKSNSEDFVRKGFKPGWFWGTVVAWEEVLGGLAMVLGFYAQLAAILYAFQMTLGTFWKLKVGRPFTDYSYDLQLLALALVIIVFGPGVYSLN